MPKLSIWAESMMYELFYLVSGALSDAEVEGVMKKVADLIRGEGGVEKRHERVTKQALAYPVKGVRHGTYMLMHFEMEDASAIKKLDRVLRLETDEVIRHLLIRLNPGEEMAAFELIPYQNPKERRESSRPARRGPPSLPPPPPVRSVPKMTVEEMDKKLDEILEGDDLVRKA
ncbi:MAG: 30S ribosomal protein S6 [Parcubacteria group bacterium GW2011_GWA2_56_7]|nr:MAG: 30S ribosomal protein S6 [Parcubacteria group bacterium GW2011_GWA2_56_7]